jgi:hypothetical protein
MPVLRYVLLSEVVFHWLEDLCVMHEDRIWFRAVLDF